MIGRLNEKNNIKKVIYYDGDCSLCIAIVKKISSSPQREKFRLQDINTCPLPQNFTKIEVEQKIHVVDADGKVYKGAEAILAILKEFPRWKFLANIGRLPVIKLLLSFGYNLVSISRHFLFGQKNKICISSRVKSLISEYWGLDLRALALLRIGLALTILFDLLVRSQDLIAHYTADGVLPAGPELPYASMFIPYFLSDSPIYVLLIFLLTAIVVLFLLVGYRIKIVTPIIWFLVASLSARNPLINNSGDIALYLFLFWGIFLPWEKRYSFDALRRPERVDRPQSVFSPATMAYTLQVLMIYLFSGLYKIPSHDWASGEGIYYMLNSTLSSGSGASFLLQFPGILSFFSHMLVQFLIITPLVLFLPIFPMILRVVAISAMMFFHIGLWLGMHLAIFPLVMIVALIGLLPSRFMDYFEGYMKKFLIECGLASIFSKYKFFFQRQQQSTLETLRCMIAPYIFILVQCIVSIALIFVLANNIERYLSTTVPVPLWIRRMGNELMLSQHWMMFDSAPHGKRWSVAVGYSKDGETVRTTLDGRRTYQDFLFHEDEYKNDRWREYDQRWHDSAYSPSLDVTGSLLSFLCRTWNQHHVPNESFEYIEIFFEYNITPPPLGLPQTSEVEKKNIIARKNC